MSNDLRKAIYAKGVSTQADCALQLDGKAYVYSVRKGIRALRAGKWLAVLDGGDTAVYSVDDEHSVLRPVTATQYESALTALLPPPAEVAHANEILGQLAIPHGYELVVRGGKPTLVAKANGRPSISATPRSGGGVGVPTFSLSAGEEVKRRADGEVFKATGRSRTRRDGKPEFEAKGAKGVVWLASLSRHYERLVAATV